MKLLLTGGAGYIGSVVTSQTARRGPWRRTVPRRPVHRASRDSVPEGAELVCRHAGIYNCRTHLLGRRFEGVLHFAAKSLVSESVAAPELYWENNVTGTAALLEAMRAADIPSDHLLVDGRDIRRAGGDTHHRADTRKAAERLRGVQARSGPHAQFLQPCPRPEQYVNGLHLFFDSLRIAAALLPDAQDNLHRHSSYLPRQKCRY